MGGTVKSVARFLSKREHALDFEGIHDPRACRGRRWSLGSLLTATFVGMVAMERCFRGVERLTRDLRGCRRRLGIERRVPDSTLARLWGRFDDEGGLRRVLIDDVKRAHRRKSLRPELLPIGVVAVDGKTIWTGKRLLNDPACQDNSQAGKPAFRLHALHGVLVSAASKPCIDQMLVPAKTNEMGALPEFVLQLSDSYAHTSLFEVMTVDAGMTSSENARVITEAKLRYVMAVKGCQATLLSEAERLCGWGEHKQVGFVCAARTPWELHRGRRIRRELYRSKEISGWPGWESARQVWRVKQTTEKKDGSREVFNRYFVTSLPWDRLEGTEILSLVRLHWGVENGCHWTMDVVLDEDDRPWCTTGQASRMLSWMRLLAYNTLGFLRCRYLRSARKRLLPWDELRRILHLALCTSSPWKPTSEVQAQATL